MLRLVPERTPLTILCLGAHADDIEIGAGGALLTLLARYPGSRVRWVVFSATRDRAAEAEASARSFLGGAAEARVDVHDVRDGFFPAAFEPLKETFEALKRELQPDLVLTHAREDHHQDHRGDQHSCSRQHDERHRPVQ